MEHSTVDSTQSTLRICGLREFNSKPDDNRVVRGKVMWQIKYVNREGQYFTSPKCTVCEFNAVLAAVVATAIWFSIIFVSGDKL